MKYRPEDKAARKERLLKMAQAEADKKLSRQRNQLLWTMASIILYTSLSRLSVYHWVAMFFNFLKVKIFVFAVALFWWKGHAKRQFYTDNWKMKLWFPASQNTK